MPFECSYPFSTRSGYRSLESLYINQVFFHSCRNFCSCRIPEPFHHPIAQLTYPEGNTGKETCTLQFLHRYTALPSNSSNINKPVSAKACLPYACSHCQIHQPGKRQRPFQSFPTHNSQNLTLHIYTFMQFLQQKLSTYCCLHHSTRDGRQS